MPFILTLFLLSIWFDFLGFTIVFISRNLNFLKLILNSTLSDYMIYPFQVRHSGMDFRNPDPMDGFELTLHGTGYPHPEGHNGLAN